MEKFAVVFPGQGSQAVGMLADLAATYPIVERTFAEASTVLGYDLWQLCQHGPESELNQTDKTQPALLAAGVATWRVWRERGGPQPVLMAGHSFGEYTALVCAEAITFTEAVSLAQDRGRFMQAAVPMGEGAAAAVLGLTDQQMIEVCAHAAQDQVVAAVNFNAPGQVVIAGHKAAIDRALVQAKAAGAKRALPLPISVPVHCSLMRPAAERMAKRLMQVTIQSPQVPIIHNVDVAIHTEAAAIRTALSTQIDHPVRWVETIQLMVSHGITHIFECGPGKVLTGLTKRIAKDLTVLPLVDTKTVAEALRIVGIE